MLECINATIQQAEQIFRLVQDTITNIYPKYYPKSVVEFFCELHSKEAIIEGIKSSCVKVLLINNRLVGTGSYKDNHITRVFVATNFQGQGYGSYIIQLLENEIALKYDTVYLDASLPASKLYEHRGYRTISHEKLEVKNNAVLVYEVMSKKLQSTKTESL